MPIVQNQIKLFKYFQLAIYQASGEAPEEVVVSGKVFVVEEEGKTDVVHGCPDV